MEKAVSSLTKMGRKRSS